jgi:hemerythrin-like domain-containing protein
MTVQIGAKPDSGFDDPIGMLMDCHRRIEHFLDILCQVAQQAQGRALSNEERAAVEAALRYFRESGPRHNMDEEDSLFPRLRRACSEGLSHIGRLEGEHREAEELHEETEKFYTRWITAGDLDLADSARLLMVTAMLQQLYREHISIEEERVFPLAAKVIDPTGIAAIGAEFKARRS